ncbi:hypothetical protein YOLOSWAG_109 [Erwinia phage vB_EamM_Yoloswag]|uniref:Uncharacterized protein n=1 Tax=Erwinia phage vB_EamM_Yoloswag TaxID=1958956 RepID=A0A1S6L330_9CAUD|nr:hypothetical protein HOR66_gp109 [Erwinia phage vB_EamM_Yoloswag]AQT28591.1 hypothetical protein YOLOSWAG_109 [Erwinia phage vB_EamM_Yoloswag]
MASACRPQSNCNCFDCAGGGFDLERMKTALAGPTYTVPQGLDRDQIIQHILDCADGKIPPDAEK